MKKIIILLSFFLAYSGSTFALEASITHAAFKSPNQTYLEIYFHIIGSSVQHIPINQDSILYTAGTEVLLTFSQQDQVIKFDKFMLNAPHTTTQKDFVDVKRYALPNGSYDFAVQLVDRYDLVDTLRFKKTIDINFEDARISQSDIQLLASCEKSADAQNPFVKMGVLMEPLPHSWYNSSKAKLFFYNEIYDSNRFLQAPFFMTYSIKSKVGVDGEKTHIIAHKRLEPASVIPVLLTMDISKLPSGNYFLSTEVRNRKKELISEKSVFFQRTNKYLDPEVPMTDNTIENEFVADLSKEELEYSIRAIAPKLEDRAETINFLLAQDNDLALRLFLFRFWTQMDPNQPELAYNKYMRVVDAVDKRFKSGFGHGFETDRGYIFLKYGKPSEMISVEDEPSAPPYEIWVYDHINFQNQNNVKFLFYNPSLSPGNFQLLHSTARGEENNPQWQLSLYSDAPNEIDGNNFIDATNMQDNMGRRAARIFNDL